MYVYKITKFSLNITMFKEEIFKTNFVSYFMRQRDTLR